MDPGLQLRRALAQADSKEGRPVDRVLRGRIPRDQARLSPGSVPVVAAERVRGIGAAATEAEAFQTGSQEANQPGHLSLSLRSQYTKRAIR